MAEIVGTLMLVVIVVAAATAFAFFVAAYQSEVQKEESLTHERALEKGRVIGVQVCSPTLCPRYYGYLNNSSSPAKIASSIVNLSFVSGDVNAMVLTDYLVNGMPVGSWFFQPQNGSPAWMIQDGCALNSTFNQSCQEVYGFQQVNVSLVFTSYSALKFVGSPIVVDVFTNLADEMTFTFLPPVAIVTASAIPEATETATLFSGLDSYQPAESDNASIVDYAWHLTPTLVNGTGSCSTLGQSGGVQVELPPEPPGDTCSNSVTLTVTNTDGLSDQTTLTYLAG